MHLNDTDEAPAPDPEAGAPAPQPADDRRARLARSMATFVAVAVFSSIVVAVGVSRHYQLFVLDESTYADYLIKVQEGEWWMPRGDIYDQETLRVIECRGVGDGTVEVRNPVGDCSEKVRPEPGASTAAIHPPTYFVVTHLMARVVLATGVTEDVVTAGRLAGAGWMTAGLLLLIVLARELGAGRIAVALLTVTIGLTQELTEQWHYLTPDAANMLVGSAVVLVGVRWLRGRVPLWAVGAVGVLAIFLKSPNILVVGATGLTILLATEAGRSLRDRIVGAATLGGATVGAAAVIAVIMSLRAESGYDSPQDLAYHVPSLTLDHFLANFGAFVTPLARDGRELGLAELFFTLVIGLVVAAAFTLPRSDVRQPLASSLLFISAVGPSVIVLLVFVAQSQYTVIWGRYGFSLLPGILAIAATFWTPARRLTLVASLAVPYAVLSAIRLF